MEGNNWNGFGIRRNYNNNTTNEDFEEEQVLWNGIAGNHREDDQDRPIITSSSSSSSSSSSAWKLSNTSSTTTPRKKIPKRASDKAQTRPNKVAQQSSAPVNIPDWSKIYGKKNSTEYHDHDHDHDHRDNRDVHVDGDEDEDEMVPPHEWIARKLARSQISSFSVCEGIGRTLKGRDLSKVRNAILTKTGFIE